MNFLQLQIRAAERRKGVRTVDIKIEVENAEKEIKLLDEASSLIGRLQSILRELNNGISDSRLLPKLTPRLSHSTRIEQTRIIGN